MNPLKQGLKHVANVCYGDYGLSSLSMNPLKQGLKPGNKCKIKLDSIVFIHESIKTRVETPSGHPEGAHDFRLYP